MQAHAHVQLAPTDVCLGGRALSFASLLGQEGSGIRKVMGLAWKLDHDDPAHHVIQLEVRETCHAACICKPCCHSVLQQQM